LGTCSLYSCCMYLLVFRFPPWVRTCSSWMVHHSREIHSLATRLDGQYSSTY
jgi:hypothetical protein